jgi:hypothetical protein
MDHEVWAKRLTEREKAHIDKSVWEIVKHIVVSLKKTRF